MGNAVEAFTDSSKVVDDFVDANKNIPNPYGRKGGIAHQTEIKNQISKYPNAQIGTEVKFIFLGDINHIDLQIFLLPKMVIHSMEM